MPISQSYYYTNTTDANTWVYSGSANYVDEDVSTKADKYIKVDKGSPDKAQFVIFYAVDEDPMIFCKTQKEVDKEIAKLMKREDVDKKSIRVFKFAGGVKVV